MATNDVAEKLSWKTQASASFQLSLDFRIHCFTPSREECLCQSTDRIVIRFGFVLFTGFSY